MAYEHKEGSGALFRNNKKEPGSKQPDIRGELMLNGVLHEVAGWVKEGKSGKWTSIAVKPKDERPAKAAPKRPADDDMSDDPLPF